jgi:hypothetical protein
VRDRALVFLHRRSARPEHSQNAEGRAVTLSTKHRRSIYERLAPLIGEEETEALLSEFPATELDRPATEGLVRAEVAGLRAELSEGRTELTTEVGKLRDLTERMRQQTIWLAGALVGSVLAGMGFAVAVASLGG